MFYVLSKQFADMDAAIRRELPEHTVRLTASRPFDTEEEARRWAALIHPLLSPRIVREV